MQISDLIDRLRRVRDNHGEIEVDVLIYDKGKFKVRRSVGEPELILARPGFSIEQTLTARIVARKVGDESD